MMLMGNQFRRPLVATLATILLGGCVVAPVPLVNNDWDTMWSGSLGGREAVIYEKQSNWYLPVLASPEGASRIRSGHVSFTYFLSFNGETERRELPFLRLEVDGGGTLGWLGFHAIDSSALMICMRTVDLDPIGGVVGRAAWIDYDLVVFDDQGLRHRRRIHAVSPDSEKQGASAHIKLVEGGRYLEYFAETGLHRYSTLENIEKLVVGAKPVN